MYYVNLFFSFIRKESKRFNSIEEAVSEGIKDTFREMGYPIPLHDKT